MSSEGYLPEVLSAGQAEDAVLHTRNKIILADFAAPSLRERIIRRLWNQLAVSRANALSRGRPAVVVSEQLIENALLRVAMLATLLLASPRGVHAQVAHPRFPVTDGVVRALHVVRNSDKLRLVPPALPSPRS